MSSALWIITGLVIVCLLQTASSLPSSHRLHRGSRAIETETSTQSTHEPHETKTCHSSTPCGWLIYAPFTRQVNFFMKNSCICSKGRACTRHEDDVSVSAYIYRCTTIKDNANKPSD